MQNRTENSNKMEPKDKNAKSEYKHSFLKLSQKKSR